MYNWASQQLKSHQTKKRLRVCETVSLGEKRFVAVVEIDGEQFLVGGAAGSVATLARLEKSQNSLKYCSAAGLRIQCRHEDNSIYISAREYSSEGFGQPGFWRCSCSQ